MDSFLSVFLFLISLIPSGIGITHVNDHVLTVRGVEREAQEEGDRLTVPMVNFESAQAPQRRPGVPRPRVRAKSALLLHARSGTILFAKNRDVVRPIASLTKLMTALVAESRLHDLDQEVIITRADDAHAGRLSVRPGDRMRARDLLFLSLVASANDATLALARASGLTRPAFVRAMNAQAQSLGLRRTRFADPTGLDAGNVSTATEIARLLTVALSRPNIGEALSTKLYRYATLGRERSGVVINTNKLLQSTSIAVRGGKTGYIDESGYNFAVEVNGRGGEEFIVVILGAAGDEERFAEAESLVRWAEEAWEYD